MSDSMRIGNVVWADGTVACAHCGHRLCDSGSNWKDHCLARRGSAADRLNAGEFGAAFKVHENAAVELAELSCPGCKAMLSVELYLDGEPYRSDYRTLEQAREAGYDPVAEFRDDAGSWLSFGARGRAGGDDGPEAAG